jgi:thiamine biosynthesis protein ThiS
MQPVRQLMVNGVRRGFDAPLSVAALLRALDLPREGVAVERNREIVRRLDYETTQLENGDEIEIVTLVGGG